MLFRKKCELFTCCRCGLAYDARIVQEPYRHLCPEHRKEPMERDRKKAEVMRWAEREWEKLYEQAKAEARNSPEQWRYNAFLKHSDPAVPGTEKEKVE